MNPVNPVPDLHHPADAAAVALVPLRQIAQGFQLGIGGVVLLLNVVQTHVQPSLLLLTGCQLCFRLSDGSPGFLQVLLHLGQGGLLLLDLFFLNGLVAFVFQQLLAHLAAPQVHLLQHGFIALLPGVQARLLIEGADNLALLLLGLLLQQTDGHIPALQPFPGLLVPVRHLSPLNFQFPSLGPIIPKLPFSCLQIGADGLPAAFQMLLVDFLRVNLFFQYVNSALQVSL